MVMARFVAPNMAVQATQEMAAPTPRGAADLRVSLITIYDLWLATWEAAAAALATASRSRALSTGEAAAHSAAINSEREFVTKHFTLLLGRDYAERPATARSVPFREGSWAHRRTGFESGGSRRARPGGSPDLTD
jgi:hypothetical protein